MQADACAFIVIGLIWTLNRHKNLPGQISLQEQGPAYNNPPMGVQNIPGDVVRILPQRNPRVTGELTVNIEQAVHNSLAVPICGYVMHEILLLGNLLQNWGFFLRYYQVQQ